MFDVAIVHAALSRIPDRQREALIRAEFGEQSAAEIGSDLGVSENAVRQLLMRARRSFRTELINEVNIAGIEVSEILSVAVRKAKEISKNAGALIVALILPLALVLGFQYFANSNNGVSIVEPDEVPTLLPTSSPDDLVQPTPGDTELPVTPETQTPSVKPSSDSSQSFKNNGVINRKSQIEETSPTLIMSEFPFNADGLIMTSEDLNKTTAVITSLEGDKVEIEVLRNQTRIEISFKLLIRGTNQWQVAEVIQLDRALSSNGGLIVNAIVQDAEGKKWGITVIFSEGYTSVQNARIVGI